MLGEPIRSHGHLDWMMQGATVMTKRTPPYMDMYENGGIPLKMSNLQPTSIQQVMKNLHTTSYGMGVYPLKMGNGSDETSI